MDKKKIIIMIWLIEVSQIVMIIWFLYTYKGLYGIGSAIPLSLIMMYVSYKICTNEYIDKFKLRIGVIVFLVLLVPVILLISRPNYSYNDGLANIYLEFPFTKEADNEKYDMDMSSIPVVVDSKALFIADREYYYKFVGKKNTSYFIVSPISGRITEIIEDYWGIDS